MMTRERRLGDHHKAGLIYDDYFHSKHYITRMNDLFTEILESPENDTNCSRTGATDRLSSLA